MHHLIKILLFASIFFSVNLFAQIYPLKPIHLVIPWPAGGVTDVVGRVIAKQISIELESPVVVDNRAGASGKIGTEFVKRAPADGYTLLLGNGVMSVISVVDPSPNYDPQKDFVSISLISENPAALLTKSSINATNLSEFIDLAKKNPGNLTFSSPGIGSTFHMLTELFKLQTGIEAKHIPYQGSTPATNAVLSAVVDFQIESTGKQFIDSGQMKVFAVTGTKRWFMFPNTPTFSELGITGLEKASWSALFAPSNTPPQIISKLNQAVNDSLKRTSVISALLQYGYSPLGGTTEDLTNHLSIDLQKWKRVVKTNPEILKQ